MQQQKIQQIKENQLNKFYQESKNIWQHLSNCQVEFYNGQGQSKYAKQNPKIDGKSAFPQYITNLEIFTFEMCIASISRFGIKSYINYHLNPICDLLLFGNRIFSLSVIICVIIMYELPNVTDSKVKDVYHLDENWQKMNLIYQHALSAKIGASRSSHLFSVTYHSGTYIHHTYVQTNNSVGMA